MSRIFNFTLLSSFHLLNFEAELIVSRPRRVCLIRKWVENGQVRPKFLLRKEVIQPLVLERLPCYDFTPIANPTFGSSLLTVRIPTSGITGSHGVTGGVYKARERIHRGMLIRDY